MLTLNDGRSELWQWDTGRALSVDADCSQVHFSNKVFGRSIDVDVVNGTAIIPDILLQTDNDLNVWAFVGTAENGYTKISKTFKVNRRNKPADYVFTPTDQMTLQTIQRQIGDLSCLTTEAKDTLVAAINEAARTGGGAGSMALRVSGGYVQYSADGGMTWTNLIAMADLKGADGITPTIGDNGNWYLGAEDTGKPSRGETGPQGTPGKDGAPGIYYGTTPPTGDTHPVWIDPDGGPDDGGLLPAVTTADNGKVLRVDNGAWAAAEMPSALPNPNALTFTGAVTGSYDGSEAMTVEIPSGVGGGGGGELTAVLIATIEGDGQSTMIEQSADLSKDGLYAVSVRLNSNLETNNTSNIIWFRVGSSGIYTSSFSFQQDANASNTISRRAGAMFAIVDRKVYNIGNASYQVTSMTNMCESGGTVHANKIMVNSGSNLPIPTGIKMKLFAFR